MPALYALAVRRLLPPRFAIVGVARTDGDDDAFRQDMETAVKQHARDPFRQEIWDELAPQLHYVATDFADAGGEDKVHDLLEQARRGASSSAATASSTSPCRRRPSPRSSRRSASGATTAAGRGSSSRSRSATTSSRRSS